MSPGNSLSRRDLFGTAVSGLTRKSGRAITGGFVNEGHVAGHRIRDRQALPQPGRNLSCPVVIVGGGIAGLSAAWRLDKRGFRDFILLEMEPEAGGNSRWGRNEITAYPWGAHYIPVPGRNLTLARELMEDLGVLRDGQWEERMLCHSPQERLFVHGRWQEGFEPDGADERREWLRFEERIAEFAAAGEFTIPVPDRPRTPELDRMSMRAWLQANGFNSRHLNWYVDYACRDDFGAHSSGTSAWMGIHYFASREHDERGPLTWPEGNGWIVRKLMERIGRYVHTGTPVLQIRRVRSGFEVLTAATSFRAQAVIWAAPTFVAPYVAEGAPEVRISYSPWVTANLTLDRLPVQRGFDAAWDNVIAGSPSLGYVVATHMHLRTHTDRTVWTWYHALADGDIHAARGGLLRTPWADWREFILNDLARAHPDIRDCVSHIDVMRYGHAMARPVPGSVFDAGRSLIKRGRNGLFFANSDLSGYSIFEEAQSNGVRAADGALHRLARSG
jgi:glycine/D-amino acid oxidase-like deaminating enzyme